MGIKEWIFIVDGRDKFFFFKFIIWKFFFEISFKGLEYFFNSLNFVGLNGEKYGSLGCFRIALDFFLGKVYFRIVMFLIMGGIVENILYSLKGLF